MRRVGHKAQSKTFALKRDAERWAMEIESKMGASDLDSDQVRVNSTITVKDIFLRYEKEVIPGMRGRNAGNIHSRIIRDAKFMRLPVVKITSKDIRDWRDDRVKEIVPSSVHRELNAISGVFTHAIKEWGTPLAANPCAAVSRFKGADKPRNKRWSDADIKTLLDSVGWGADKPIKDGRGYVGWCLLLGLETAMRIGEICTAKVGDFHPAEQRLHLPITKNGDARNVPLSTKAISYLQFLCKNKQPEDKIIGINANTFTEYFLDARRACGLEHLVMHDSRHTAATRLSTMLPNVLEL